MQVFSSFVFKTEIFTTFLSHQEPIYINFLHGSRLFRVGSCSLQISVFNECDPVIHLQENRGREGALWEGSLE